MSEDRSPLDENEERGTEDGDVEAHRLIKANDEPDGPDDDVEAHVLSR